MISCFASTKKYQPWGEFRDKPKVIDVSGIGSNQYMGPNDTERKPREAWGGKPFSREAAMFAAKGGGSILQGLLKSRAPGITPRRIALIGFSAGNTFLSAVLKNSADAELLDTVIALDGMTYPKDYSGNAVGFDHWINFAKRASGMDRMQSAANPYLGPLLVVSYTDIVSASPSRVSSTREAARYLLDVTDKAYWPQARSVPADVLDLQSSKQLEVKARLGASCAQVPLPLRIKGGNPPTTKEWTSPPYPNDIGYLGNSWFLGWGGTQGPDHIFQAHQCQKILFRTFLMPRWNARSEAVAGLGVNPDGLGAVYNESRIEWETPQAQQAGGGIVQQGALDTGVSLWKMGLVAGGAFWVGRKLIDSI